MKKITETLTMIFLCCIGTLVVATTFAWAGMIIWALITFIQEIAQ